MSAEEAAAAAAAAEKAVQSTLYPPHFQQGARIELGSGEIKRVEDLTVADFERSTTLSKDLKLDTSVLIKIEIDESCKKAFLCYLVGPDKVQITIEAPLEHPFFVYGKGWCAVEPLQSLARYKLNCQYLIVGDTCASLTLK